MKIFTRFVIFALLIALNAIAAVFGGAAGCGGGGGSEQAPQGSDQQISLNIATTGGTVELPGVAKVEFPAGAFEAEAIVSLSKISSSEIAGDYIKSTAIFEAGDSAEWMLQADVTRQPLEDSVVEIIVPDDLFSKLGEDYVPRLFMEVVQLGADNESIDDFEPLDSAFDPSTKKLSVILPTYAFSNLLSDDDNAYRAIIIIGSSLKKRYQAPLELDAEEMANQSLMLKSMDDSKCNGTTIGPPLSGELTVTGEFKKGVHWGVDLKAPDGSDVLSVADGTIETVGWDLRKTPNRVNYPYTGWGRYVVIKHLDGSRTLYAHLQKDSTDDLKIGQQVKTGDVFAKSDTSGGTNAPHLHLEYSPTGELFSNKDSKVNPFLCVSTMDELMSIISIKVDDPDWTFNNIPIEIQLNVPADYYDEAGMAAISIHEDCPSYPTGDYWCNIGFTVNLSNNGKKTRQIIPLVPQGSANFNITIYDIMANRVFTTPINISWDCCDDPNKFSYNKFSKTTGACEQWKKDPSLPDFQCN